MEQKPLKRKVGRPKVAEVVDYSMTVKLSLKELNAMKVCAESVGAKSISAFARGLVAAGVYALVTDLIPMRNANHKTEYLRLSKHFNLFKHLEDYR